MNGRSNKLLGNTSQVRSVAFSLGGTLAVGSKFGVGGEANTLTLWDVSTRQRTVQTLLTSNGEVHRAIFSPNGTLIAAGGCHEILSARCTKGELRLWDASAPAAPDEPLQLYDKAVRNLAFSPDGLLLAVVNDDSMIYLWDTTARQQIGEPLQGHTGRIWGLAFSSDGKMLASAGDNGVILLWDAVERKQIGTPLRGHTARIHRLAFSPDNKTIASASCSDLQEDDQCQQGEIRFWNVTNHQQDGEPLIAHTDWVLSLAFSPDGNFLASGGGDDNIIVRNAPNRTQKFTLAGHTGDIWSLDFSPDGRLLASASGGNDRTVIVWEVAALPQTGISLRGHSGYVRSVAFSPGSNKLLSSAADGTIRLWDSGFNSWKSRACSIANRNLTQAEWNQYIGSERPYERTCKQFPPGEGAPPDAP